MSKFESYFSHDVHAHSDPKIKRLMKKFSHAGYGRFWHLVELMAMEEGRYAIDLHSPEDYDYLSTELDLEENDCKEFIQYCVHVKLFSFDDGVLSSASLHRRMYEREERKRKLSEAGKRGNEKRWGANKETHTQPAEAMKDKWRDYLPEWFAAALNSFKDEYPPGTKSFINSADVERQFSYACKYGGNYDKTLALQICQAAKRYKLYIQQLEPEQVRYELKSASEWLKNKGWTNSYHVDEKQTNGIDVGRFV